MSNWFLLEWDTVRKRCRQEMKVRTYITISAIIIYVLLFNLYLYELTKIPIKNSKLFYNYLTLGMLLFALLDLKAGFVGFMHTQLNLICFSCLIINYIIIILTHHVVLKNTDPLFYVFNGSVFATTLMIGSSIYRHDYYE